MKKLLLNLCTFLVLLVFFSCSHNERELLVENKEVSKTKNEVSSRNASNMSDDLKKINEAINEMCNLNNINNKIEFIEVLDNSLTPFETLNELKNYNFQYSSSVAINSNGSYNGILHIGTVELNHIVIAHELPDGNIDDLIEIKVNTNSNNLWSSSVKSIFNTTAQNRKKMTRAECERQTTDLVMAGTAFTGLTGWWCPPCGFAGSIVTGMVAVGYFTCRL